MDIPTTRHWAIITERRHYTPGDERSRTHPGHGYPESYEDYINYEAYIDIEEWREQVRYLIETNKQFRAIEAIPQIVHIEIKTVLVS